MSSQWHSSFRDFSKTLNDLSMAHSRYLKAQNEWAEKLSTEEKLNNTLNYVAKLHEKQPEVVERWMERLQLELDETRRMRHQGLMRDDSL